MKNNVSTISVLLLLLFSSCRTLLSAQTTNKEIPSKLISGKNIKPFIDSLKQKILSDTIKFNHKNLQHINGKTENLKPYSMLFSVNVKYNYRLDIVENEEVKNFVKEILQSKNIQSINLVNEQNAISLMGSQAKNGWIIINLKQKVNLNFNVGGLKYNKGKKRRGGNNFLQHKAGEIMIRT